MARPVKVISQFDVCLGRVVKSKRVKASHTRASFAEATGIPEANLKRREEGQNEITVSELERIAEVVGVSALKIVNEALEDYGGIEKLLAEHRGDGPMSDGAPTVTPSGPVSPADNVTYLGHVKPPMNAAADDDPRTGPKD
ncbi:helix-turn-helix transcriptional regulator [Microbacterium sp. NPDC078814]|uniref:helix-turn-helix domain-containing protein n=1 Tax=Microbacterium sp. NPDC078814 TaxID=3154767 RepID=UPI00344E3EC2